MADYFEVCGEGAIRGVFRFPVILDSLWEWLTEPDYLGFWLAQAKLEPRQGGAVELRFDPNAVAARNRAGTIIHGAVTRWEPVTAVAYTWIDASREYGKGENPLPDSEVRFELSISGVLTELTVTHERLPRAMMVRCAAGWHAHLSSLGDQIDGKQPMPFRRVFERMLVDYTARLAV